MEKKIQGCFNDLEEIILREATLGNISSDIYHSLLTRIEFLETQFLNGDIRERVLIDFLDNIKKHPEVRIPYDSGIVVNWHSKSIEERT